MYSITNTNSKFGSFTITCIENIQLGDIELIIKNLSNIIELLSKMHLPKEEKERPNKN